MVVKIRRIGQNAAADGRGGRPWRRGRRPDLGHHHFRSGWEANYARYLNWLKEKGEIFNWDYEADIFWFDKIKRGVRSYTPDFKVWETANSEPCYHEVKGWMDPRSKTKIKRMRIYHPKIKLIVIDSKAYRALAKYAALIPGWE